MTERFDPTERIGSGGLQPRARFATDAVLLPLDGEWRFRLWPSLAEAPDGLELEDLDDSAWATIPVPSSWPMQGHGTPAYTNVVFPFPVDPPHPPDENPVGDFRRTFDWDGGPAILRLDGVDAAGQVWLNGTFLGTTRGSRLVAEFDASGAIRSGTNLLAVRVTQWAATSYLEDQDMWWLPGIFRSVGVQAAPAGGIQDVRLVADWDAATSSAVLTVDVDTRDGALARISVPSLGLTDLAPGVPHPVPGAPAWTAETPELVEVRVATDAETATLAVGFRRITIEDAQLKVNGRRIRFRGVNRHEFHPDFGRAVPIATMHAELLQMKRSNVNAIRTSHYPPHPDLPALADELGFWLIDECDLETHGFALVDWRGNPSDDPDWRDACLDRMTRTIARDRNHASVILWSLGNEAGTGANLDAMGELAGRLDPTRPRHYEGDRTCAAVDVYSRMYAPQEEVDAIGRQAEDPLPDAAQDARRRAMPFLLCEYAHAMGNGPGGMDEYEASFDAYPRTQGGFVWEWLEHGIRRRTADGGDEYAYGGDFGEPVHDGNFVADGLVDADRRPRPGLADWAAVVAPLRLTVLPDRGAVRLRNRHDFVDSSAFRVQWCAADGVWSDLDVGTVAAGQEAEVPLPPVSGLLTVRAVTRQASPWAPAGHEVAWAQSVPAPPPAARRGTAGLTERDGALALGPGRFDARSGRLVGLGAVPVHGPDLVLWRAPTDNDRGVGWSEHPARPDAVGWQEAGLDRLRSRVVAIEQGTDSLAVTRRVAAAGRDEAVLCELVWTAEGDALILDARLQPLGEWDTTWARAGLELLLPFTAGGVRWTGRGPAQRYPDTGQAARFGEWSLPSVRDLHTDYVRPQENGSRAGVRRLEVDGAAGVLTVAGEGFSFTASPWTSAELAAASHPSELPDSRRTRLTIDLAEHGVGTAACGPGVLPRYRLTPRVVETRLVLSAR